MKRSEVMDQIQKAEHALAFARNGLEFWLEELEEAECDHPEFADHICDYCGAYVEYSEEILQAMDDSNVTLADTTAQFYPDAPLGSMYFRWPLTRAERDLWSPQVDSLESWQTYGPDA